MRNLGLRIKLVVCGIMGFAVFYLGLTYFDSKVAEIGKVDVVMGAFAMSLVIVWFISAGMCGLGLLYNAIED